MREEAARAWDSRGVRLIERLANAVGELSTSRARVLVAIDGPDAAGKTTLADQLADQLAERLTVPAFRASIDGFHQPRERRHRRGGLSPEGYYRDSFDDAALTSECLRPFRDGGSEVRLATYDYRVDAQTDAHRPTVVPPRAVLVFDGVFLLRERLRELWTMAVYVRITPEESLRRARIRDLELFGSRAEVDRRYLARYLPGQVLYRDDADPESFAHVIVDNERADAPTVERWRLPDTGRS